MADENPADVAEEKRVRKEAEKARLTELKAKYGERTTYYVVPGYGEYVVTAHGKRSAYDQWQIDVNMDGFDPQSAARNFVLNCTTEPERKQATTILTEYPRLVMKIQARLFALFGGDIEEAGKD